MTQKVFRYLRNYKVDPFSINRLIVSTFLYVNKINVANNILLINHIITPDQKEEYKALILFSEIIIQEKLYFNIEDIIELFEYVISPADKKVNGAVYTPSYIRSFIIDSIINEKSNKKLAKMTFADISCGCGGFFYTLAKAIKERTNKSIYNIFKDNIYGVDIENYSIIRTKLLLSLFAITNGEDKIEFDFNLFVANSLEFNWNNIEEISKNNGFDAVIGNPPYVSSSKIDDKSRNLLKRWSVCSVGKPDLYIPFFQIGVECLKPNGILGYITVSNFYRSLNGRGIRNYFSENSFPIKIIDFGSEQIFKGRSTYTCICLITRSNKGELTYIKQKSKKLNLINDNDYIKIQYDNISNFKGWILLKPNISNNIHKIESTGVALGELIDIRNGFATLKNNIFLFNSEKEDAHNYYFTKNKTRYAIEKAICRDAIKPNTLKYESQIKSKSEKLIFPYSQKIDSFDTSTNVKIIEEINLKLKFPLAYKYLKENKEILNQRDKGKGKYETWYAFGRNQAINIHGYKLLFPYISNKPYFVLSEQKDLLFYNGYALVSESKENLIIAKKVLCSKIFWYYIKHTSKPYGGEYFALSKNYIKNFGMYNFNNEERNILLSLENKKDIDNFLIELYKIEI